MFVAASSDCFDGLSLDECVERLVDLEYSNIEVSLHESSDELQPSRIAEDLASAVDRCHETRRLNVCAYAVDTGASGDLEYERFDACCLLAKATKVVTLSIDSNEHGTPFNEEVERLRKLVAIAESHGARVALKNQIGRLSEDPDTVKVFCDNVPGLGLTLDPSHFLCGKHKGRDYSRLLPHVYHVHLRDSTRDQLQVKIGQGEIEYGKLISQLRKLRYDRSLTVHIQPLDMQPVDHHAELRKMRLLLESLLD